MSYLGYLASQVPALVNLHENRHECLMGNAFFVKLLLNPETVAVCAEEYKTNISDPGFVLKMSTSMCQVSECSRFFSEKMSGLLSLCAGRDIKLTMENSAFCTTRINDEKCYQTLGSIYAKHWEDVNVQDYDQDQGKRNVVCHPCGVATLRNALDEFGLLTPETLENAKQMYKNECPDVPQELVWNPIQNKNAESPNGKADPPATAAEPSTVKKTGKDDKPSNPETELKSDDKSGDPATTAPEAKPSKSDDESGYPAVNPAPNQPSKPDDDPGYVAIPAPESNPYQVVTEMPSDESGYVAMAAAEIKPSKPETATTQQKNVQQSIQGKKINKVVKSKKSDAKLVAADQNKKKDGPIKQSNAIQPDNVDKASNEPAAQSLVNEESAGFVSSMVSPFIMAVVGLVFF